MLLFAAILIAVVIRNLEAPIKFGTRIGPVLVGTGLVLFALPIYGSVMATQILDRPTPYLRILAAILVPVGLYLMKPLTRHARALDPAAEAVEVEAVEVEEPSDVA